MDAGRVALGTALLVAGVAFLVHRERLGERARARGAAFGAPLYVVAGALLLAFGVLSIVAAVLAD